ncbi:putative gluconokinase [Fusarium oxysporum f. sp. albedinis]|nr:putative gluconokinase [Fusarium oxysporum f. sp. albedinis]
MVRLLVNQGEVLTAWSRDPYQYGVHDQSSRQSGRGTYILKSPSISIYRLWSDSSLMRERYLRTGVAIHINIMPMVRVLVNQGRDTYQLEPPSISI